MLVIHGRSAQSHHARDTLKEVIIWAVLKKGMKEKRKKEKEIGGEKDKKKMEKWKKKKRKKQVYSLMNHMSRERDDLCPEGFFSIDGSNCVFLGSSRPSRMSPRRRRSQIMRTLSPTTTRVPSYERSARQRRRSNGHGHSLLGLKLYTIIN